MPESVKNDFGSPLPCFGSKMSMPALLNYRDALGFELRSGSGEEFACVALDNCSLFLTTDNQSQGRMWIWIGVEE